MTTVLEKNKLPQDEVAFSKGRIPCDIERERAHIYALLSALLAFPANNGLIDIIQNCKIDSDSWKALQANLHKVNLDELNDEYHRLFIGIGTGELIPYFSHYKSGFLMSQPLLELREELQSLGLEVQENQKNPEDHVSGIFEIMRVSIADLALPFNQQKQFFQKYIHSWVNTFFKDLEKTTTVESYKLIAQFGQWFMGIEKQYFGYTQ